MSGGDLKLSLIVQAIDQLSGPADKMGARIKGLVSGTRSMVSELSGHFQKISHSYEGIAAAVGGGFEIREIMQDNDAFNRLRIDTAATGEEVEEFRDKLFTTALQARVPLNELSAGFKEMRQRGMELHEIEPDLDVLGTTIQRLGGHGEDIGALISVLTKFEGIKGPDQLLQTMATFREQFGGMTERLTDFMNAAPALLSTYGELGQSGERAAREIAGLYATVAQGAANPRAARSTVENILGLLGTRENAFKLEAMQVPVYGRTREEHDANLRAGHIMPISEILPDLLKQYAKMPFLFNEMLGPSFQRDFRVPLSEMQRGGSSPTMQRMFDVQGDPAKLLHEADEASHNFSASLDTLNTSLKKVGDQVLASPLEKFADVIAGYPTVVGSAVTALGSLAIIGVASGWIMQGWGALKTFAGVLAPAAALIGDLTLALRAGYAPMMALNLAMAANPLGMVIVAAAAVLTLGYEIYEHWDKVKKLFSSISPPSMKADDGTEYMVDTNTGTLVPLTAPSRPSAFDRPAGAPAADGKSGDVSGQIVVRFDNAPPGTRVDSARSNNPNVGFNLDMGYSMVGP